MATGEHQKALRHALHLIQLSPREFRPREHEAIDEESYEAFLAAGDLDAAARRLVAAPTLAVGTTSTPDGVEAAVRCKTLDLTIFGQWDTVAAAILQAWTKCLFAVRGELESSLLGPATKN